MIEKIEIKSISNHMKHILSISQHTDNMSSYPVVNVTYPAANTDIPNCRLTDHIIIKMLKTDRVFNFVSAYIPNYDKKKSFNDVFLICNSNIYYRHGQNLLDLARVRVHNDLQLMIKALEIISLIDDNIDPYTHVYPDGSVNVIASLNTICTRYMLYKSGTLKHADKDESKSEEPQEPEESGELSEECESDIEEYEPEESDESEEICESEETNNKGKKIKNTQHKRKTKNSESEESDESGESYYEDRKAKNTQHKRKTNKKEPEESDESDESDDEPKRVKAKAKKIDYKELKHKYGRDIPNAMINNYSEVIVYDKIQNYQYIYEVSGHNKITRHESYRTKISVNSYIFSGYIPIGSNDYFTVLVKPKKYANIQLYKYYQLQRDLCLKLNID